MLPRHLQLFLLAVGLAFLFDALRIGIPSSPASDDDPVEEAQPSSSSSSLPDAEKDRSSAPLLWDHRDDRPTTALTALLDRIVEAPYFRFVRVNTHRECPYWAVAQICTASPSSPFDGSSSSSSPSPCTLCTCDPEAVPLALRDPSTIVGDPALDLTVPSSTSAHSLPQLDATSFLHHHQQQQQQPTHASTSLTSASSPPEEVELVDLVRNPEANTGYAGPQANRVWEAIYRENCFVGTPTKEEGQTGEGGGGEYGTCEELKIFYRLMSGFHSSIGLNIAVHFHPDQSSPSNDDNNHHPHNGQEETEAAMGAATARPQYRPNCEMHQRMRSFRDRVDNLKFLHAFVYRALRRARGSIRRALAPLDDLSIPSSVRDALLQRLLGEQQEEGGFQGTSPHCQLVRDHTHFFRHSSEGARLQAQVSRVMQNITTLMDCLHCQKCRLWGKVEMHGVAVAVRVLLTSGGQEFGEHSTSTAPFASLECDDDHGEFGVGSGSSAEDLTRADIVALVNLFRQVNLALWSVEHVCPAA